MNEKFTLKQWVETNYQDPVKTELLNEIVRQERYGIYKLENVFEAQEFDNTKGGIIGRAITWAQTEQGSAYWSNLFHINHTPIIVPYAPTELTSEEKKSLNELAEKWREQGRQEVYASCRRRFVKMAPIERECGYVYFDSINNVFMDVAEIDKKLNMR